MKTLASLLLLLLMLVLLAIDAVAQPLRDAVRSVDGSVVVVKTVEKNLRSGQITELKAQVQAR